MGGSSDANRLAQVRMWVAERAAGLGVPVSVELLCETAVVRLEVSGVALTVASVGWPEVRHVTDALGTRLMELHLTVGEGPCVDVRRTGGPVLVADLDSPTSQRRWPLFAPLAVEAGAGALFALPLCVGAIHAGVLAAHRVEAGRLEGPALTDSLAFAQLALELLLTEQDGTHPLDGGSAERLPLHSVQLHQATGMIAGQLDIGMEDAFTRLRARAFVERRPLSELAADVVAHRVRFDPAKDGT